MDEINQYHPLTSNIEFLKQRREEFYVSKFLSGLHSNLQAVKANILAGDGSIPSLDNVYSRVLRARLRLLRLLAEIILHFVTSSGPRGSFRGRGYSPSYSRGHGGRGSSAPVISSSRGRGGYSPHGRGFGLGRGRGSLYCTYYGGDNHTVDRCYDLHGKP